MLLGKVPRKLVGRHGDARETFGEVGIKLSVVLLILRKLSGVLHEAVGDHGELELLVLGVGDAVGGVLGQWGVRDVHEPDGGDAFPLEGLHRSDHLCGVAGHGREDHDALFGDAPVAHDVKLPRVLHRDGEVAELLDVGLDLERRCPRAADAHVADEVVAPLADLVHHPLDLGTNRERAIDAVQLVLPVILDHLGRILTC